MELRLKSEESKETIRIEVSDHCTLENLKQTLASSLHLSINRKDELQGSSPEDSLSSLGITSGDLVYFTLNPSKFSSQQGTSIQSSSQDKGKQIMQCHTLGFDLEKLRLENSEHESPIGNVLKNCWRSNFLRRVLRERLGHDRNNAHKLLVTAVHAVLLESGFVPIDRFYIPENWPSPSFSISIRYALPRPSILNNDIVLLKFQSLVHFVIVYESLSCNVGSNVCRVSFDERTFAPILDLIWEDLMSNKVMDEDEWNNIEMKLSEFWKVVKNDLALPFFMLLPDEMKHMILQALSGAEIGRIQCVCTELRNLGSRNDLWKMKFMKEFPLEDDSIPENGLWKPKFVASYRNKMMRNMIVNDINDELQQPDIWQDFEVPAYEQPYAYGILYALVPWPHAFSSVYWHHAFASVYWNHAFSSYHGWRGLSVYNAHHGILGLGLGRGRGRGRGRRRGQ